MEVIIEMKCLSNHLKAHLQQFRVNLVFEKRTAKFFCLNREGFGVERGVWNGWVRGKNEPRLASMKQN